MPEIALPLATAFFLGALHAFEADHLAAVGAFVVRRPAPGESFGFGLRWAAGHGLALLTLGTALVAMGLRLPDSAAVMLERLVGLGLIILGVWTANGVRRIHVHEHGQVDRTPHGHVHSHRAITALGALHGLAGTAPVLALVPLARFDSVAGAAGYLSVFGIGTALAMAIFAASAGMLVGAGGRPRLVARGIVLLTAAATIVIGVIWLVAPR